MQKTLSHLPMILYMQSPDNSSLLSIEKAKTEDLSLLKSDVQQAIDKMNLPANMKNSRPIPFKARMKQALKNVQIEARYRGAFMAVFLLFFLVFLGVSDRARALFCFKSCLGPV